MTNLCKIVAALLTLFTLCSCSSEGTPAVTEESKPESSSAVTEFLDLAAPEDGGINIESATAGEILDYFAEIAFGSEFGTSVERLCRWESEIFYTVTGTPTDKDLALVDELVEKLNVIDGFPGIAEADSAEDANFEIMFIPKSEIIEKFKDAPSTCSGMSEYTWDTTSFKIISARAAIDCDETEERNSVICEEILQALGLAKDSYAHKNSVFYQGKCVYNRPSELDWTMVRVLYHTSLSTGMSKYEAIKETAGILKW